MTEYRYDNRRLLVEMEATILGAGVRETELGQPELETFMWDGLGRPTEFTNPVSTLSYSYDSLSRILSETRGEHTGVVELRR